MSEIDLQQVWILTRYALLSEWRTASTRMNRRRKMSRGWAYGTMFSYLLIGAFSIRLFLSNDSGEAFTIAAGIFMLYAGIVIASNIFLSFGSGFLSPDESRMIGLLPVSSDTFFFSRLTVLLCYTTAISLLLLIGPFLALQFFLREGTWVELLGENLIFAFAFLLSGIAASMAVIALYGIVMRKLSAAKVAKVTGYVQFFGSFVTAISFVVLSQVQHRINLHSITLTDYPWIAFVPAYWFASLGSIGLGTVSSITLLFGALSVLFLAVLAATSHLLLGKNYQSEVDELSGSATALAKSKKSKPDSFLYRLWLRLARSDEARTMFQVLRAQFRYDAKFRMQMLASLPPTFLYLLIAVMQGGIVDPFSGPMKGVLQANMLYLVAMLMPLISMQAISQSDNYKAAWIFFSAPIDRSKLLLAVRNTMFVSIIAPYMVLIAIVFSYYMPVAHAVMHTLVIAAIASVIFQCFLMAAPKMPFAQQRRPNRGGFAMMVGIFSFA
ncbi:MAG TPA: hypothetical protein VGM92_07425, partial [Candidatus Kapabacteria bacterium]